MTSLEEIRSLKKQYGYTNEQMARLSGLPLSTVQKVLGGTTASPRHKTIEALASVFPEKTLPVSPSYTRRKTFPGVIREPQAAYAAQKTPTADQERKDDRIPVRQSARYPRQGSYTLEDYLALPDEQRVELIDGVFYDMSAPSIPHQLIGGAIYAKLLSFLAGKHASCMPFIAPTDVQLDRDNRTILQPDVMVVCDRSKITYARIFGAPDFVIEVISPGTKSKDMLIKTAKYKAAGVREYWMVDPRQETITKMLFEKPDEEYPDGDIRTQMYSYDEPVPVSIFQDECLINFREIADSYAFLSK